LKDLGTFGSEELKVTFGIKGHAIDVKTLADVLNELNAIVNNIGNEYRVSKVLNFNIDFKIHAFNQGSFEILSAIQPIFSDVTIFSSIKDTLQFVPMLIDIFKIKKILKDEKISETDIVIENQNNIDVNNGTINITQNTYNIYANSQENVSDLFGVIDVNPNIDSSGILSKEEKLDFNKTEFGDLKVLKDADYFESSTSQITGNITSLRSTNPLENKNQVDIKGLIDNKISDIATATLDAEQYKLAISAHQSQKRVKIIGELMKLKTKHKFTRVDNFLIL
jgi:hypothetical protein